MLHNLTKRQFKLLHKQEIVHVGGCMTLANNPP